MAQLESALAPLIAEERRSALDYYENYFDDAGEENVTRVIEELGSPQALAAQILREAAPETLRGSAYREPTPAQRTEAAQAEPFYHPPVPNLGVWLGLLLALVLSPIWLTMLIVVGALALAAIIVVGAFGIAGAAMIVGGIAALTYSLTVGLITGGAGLVLLGLCILLIVPLVRGTFRLMVRFARWIFDWLGGLAWKKGGAVV
ncbi:MAG: hypothetical protein QM689_03985 [Oscillospiraceae bacterium]